MLDDQEFRKIIDHLGLSWKGYLRVRKGVKKRICRHMRLLGCQDISSYLFEMGEEREVRLECERLLTVSISRFFRDKRLWEVLHKELLHGLLNRYTGKTRVWSAGCASGEEVYSLKIVWDSIAGFSDRHVGLEITATDMNAIHLQRARDGTYPPSSLRELPGHLRSRYFITKGDESLFEVKASLKEGIIWLEHNLLSDPSPGPCFDMILLRNNLLTYYRDELKKEALEKVLMSLSGGGFLIIGSHEKLPLARHDLVPFGSLSYVYQKGC
jgi:chemotaxis protein methyltransferase CheR